MSKRKRIDLEYEYVKKQKEEMDKKMLHLAKARESCASESDADRSGSSDSEEDRTPVERPSDDEDEQISKYSEFKKETGRSFLSSFVFSQFSRAPGIRRVNK